MKRTLTAALAVTLATLGLAACSPTTTPDQPTSAAQTDQTSPTNAATAGPETEISREPSPSSSPTPLPRDTDFDALVIDLIGWNIDGDGHPVLEFNPPLSVSGPTVKLVQEGTGPVIAEGDEITFDYVMYAGDTGEKSYSTYDTNKPQTIILTPDAMSQTFADAVIGQKVGMSLIFASIDTSGNAVSDYLVTQFMAVTVTNARSVLARAEGTPVAPVAGLPIVTLADDGAPSIEIPASPPPASLVAQALIEGDGAKVAEGQTVLLHLAGWLWSTGEQFDSTWESATPQLMDLTTDATLPGILNGLVGQRVGSQLLLIVPPSLGLGSTETEVIPADSTLVFVIDILAAL